MFQSKWAVGALIAIVSSSQIMAAEVAELRSARESITPAELRTHVSTLADDTFEGREAGSRGGRAAAGYLAKQLQDRKVPGGGDDGGYFQYFGNCRNVLGFIRGQDAALRGEVIVVGAHYDHVGYGSGRTSLGPVGYIHNGADDNASGVAGLLELADALTNLSSPPRRSVLIAFWDGEEQGLWGSQHWVSHPTVPLKNVATMVNVDMIGRLRDERIEVFGIRTAVGFRELLCRQNVGNGLRCDFNWEMKPNSDHHSFFARNVPVLMIHTGLHEDYHRPSDDIEKVNVDGIARVTRLLFDIVYNLAERTDRAVFRNASRNESPADRQQLEEPLPAVPPRLGIVWEQAAPDLSGIRITRITPGTAADRAGLRIGDRLLNFAGSPITSDDQFRYLVASSEKPVEAIVHRDGVADSLRLTVELDGKPARIGLSWREDPAEPHSAIVVRVFSGSPADLSGVRLRDRIWEVNGHRLESDDHLRELLSTEALPLEILIERQGCFNTVRVDVPR